MRIWDWIVAEVMGDKWQQCKMAFPNQAFSWGGSEKRYGFFFCQRHCGHWGKHRTHFGMKF